MYNFRTDLALERREILEKINKGQIDGIETEEKEINVLLSVINSSKVWTGAVTTPSPQYELELLDVNNHILAKILQKWTRGHLLIFFSKASQIVKISQ